MKYNVGDSLFYINPFVFTIDKVKIVNYLNDSGIEYFIEEGGAYLIQEDLFSTLDLAQAEAIVRLNKFHSDAIDRIVNWKEGEVYGDDFDFGK